MVYAITQSCCADATCVSVCPVDCIHPTPDEPDFGTAEMLYVDPRSCIDCGACADACPVDAVKPVDLLRGGEEVFAQLNADYYAERELEPVPSTPTFAEAARVSPRTLRVAVVGTGPAASYAARQLLTGTDASISMIDRLPMPGGLVRAGVAPDHPSTKQFGAQFEWVHVHPRTRMYMNVEVGRDISHDELLRFHDAVIYGVGARADRELGVPGEELDGVHGAPEVVGWYNGHPDVPEETVRVVGERAVVVGNGNVALDIARLLLSDPERLAETDMADHAVEALRAARVREVVLVGRRGPEHAAFTRPELLMWPEGIEQVVAEDPVTAAALDAADGDMSPKVALLARLPRITLDGSPPPPGRRVVWAFGREVSEVLGTERAEGVVMSSSDPGTRALELAAGLVVRSTGHRGRPVAGLPFDPASSTVPNESGRVIDADGTPVPGAYVVGWIKRGATGGIGANRQCAHETVSELMADAGAGVLAEPQGRERDLVALLRRRSPHLVGRRAMRAIDRAERRHGREQGRPRVKFTTLDDLLRATRWWRRTR